MLKFDMEDSTEKYKAVEFRDVLVGDTIIYKSAYLAAGLDLNTNVVYIKINDDEILELNHHNRINPVDMDKQFVKVDLLVNEIKLA